MHIHKPKCKQNKIGSNAQSERDGEKVCTLKFVNKNIMILMSSTNGTNYTLCFRANCFSQPHTQTNNNWTTTGNGFFIAMSIEFSGFFVVVVVSILQTHLFIISVIIICKRFVHVFNLFLVFNFFSSVSNNIFNFWCFFFLFFLNRRRCYFTQLFMWKTSYWICGKCFAYQIICLSCRHTFYLCDTHICIYAKHFNHFLSFAKLTLVLR